MAQKKLSKGESQTLTKKPTRMSNQIEDSVLVRDYISGDEKSLEVLINRHNQRITSFIYSKVLDRDITEDIFQDTFIKVIKTLKKGSYSEEGKFLPWVMRIAHNLIIDHFRKNKRMPKFEGSDDFNIFSVIGDDKLNAEKQLIKSIKKTTSKTLKFIEKRLKLVSKHYYRSVGLVMGMLFGPIFTLSFDGLGYNGLGMVVGMFVGIVIGAKLDDKAAKEGKQLDVENIEF